MTDLGIKNAISALIHTAEVNGFITYDNLMDVLDEYRIPLSKTDFVAEQISSHGYRIYDHIPDEAEINKQQPEMDEEYADYAQSDYEAIFARVLEIEPALIHFIDHLKTVRAAQHGETAYLFRNMHSVPGALDRIFEMNLRAVVRLALNAYRPGDVDLSDLIQQGALGLLHAIQKFDPNSENAFGSYMNYWVIQYISRGNPYRGNGCYFPVHMQDLIKSILPIIESHNCPQCPSNILSCNVLIEACREKVECSAEEVIKLLSYTLSPVSLDYLLEKEYDKNFEELLIGDQSPENCELIQTKMCSAAIANMLGYLTEKERSIIKMRYGFISEECKTLEECGTYYGITRERVRQIEMKAIEKLSQPVRTKILKDFLYN